MKKLLFAIAFLLISVPVWANQVIVQYSYTGTASSFRLYMNSLKVCEVPTPTPPGTFTCNLVMPTGPVKFNLSAIDSNSVESPQSPDYIFTPGNTPLINFIIVK